MPGPQPPSALEGAILQSQAISLHVGMLIGENAAPGSDPANHAVMCYLATATLACAEQQQRIADALDRLVVHADRIAQAFAGIHEEV